MCVIKCTVFAGTFICTIEALGVAWQMLLFESNHMTGTHDGLPYFHRLPPSLPPSLPSSFATPSLLLSWVPRLFEFTLNDIADRGQEATFIAISFAPQHMVGAIAGPMSGVLLENYCPKVGLRRSWIMWVIIGATTVITPVALFFMRPWYPEYRGLQAKACGGATGEKAGDKEPLTGGNGGVDGKHA